MEENYLDEQFHQINLVKPHAAVELTANELYFIDDSFSIFPFGTHEMKQRRIDVPISFYDKIGIAIAGIQNKDESALVECSYGDLLVIREMGTYDQKFNGELVVQSIRRKIMWALFGSRFLDNKNCMVLIDQIDEEIFNEEHRN